MSHFQWSYVVEVCKSPNPRADDAVWEVIGDFDTPEKATKYADECGRTPIRVRQFKVTILNAEPKALPPPVNHEPTVVDLVQYYCPAHPTQKAMGLPTTSPRCPDCKDRMFKGSPGDIINLHDA